MVQNLISNIHTNGSVKNDKEKNTLSVSENSEHKTKGSSCKSIRLYLSLTIGSLGIIFGDIGTSPLYVIRTIFADNLHPTRQQCIGAISLVIWNLIIVASIKYGIFILMADNRGEGGTFALCALLTGEHSRLRARAKHVISIVSIFAASLLIGDGALTPAISVLSAVEGLATTSQALTKLILPVTVFIIVILFFVQMFGSSKIGLTFAPIMIVWFVVLFSIGIWRITFDPSILRAFNPWEAVSYLIREKQKGFMQIGGVFLSVTGLEAFYADLGHFGRGPVRTSWLCVVLPSVVANYLGQGALIMHSPEMISNPFYNAGPACFRWPLIILATMATIIASQAIITGVFSLISQAASLGFSPPLRVIHTSKKVIGQIYVPAINWIILLMTISITLYFRSSGQLAHAYGVTVCSDMLITSILYMCVMRYVWNNHWIRVALFGTFLIIDITFLSANVVKFFEGAWVALLIAIVFFIFGFSWYYGQTLLRKYLNFYAQTTTLIQLPVRLGLSDLNGKLTQESKHEEFKRSGSLLLDYQTASSDEEDDDTTNEKVNMPPESLTNTDTTDNNRFEFIDDSDDDNNIFRISSTGNVAFTVTPGLGVFLTTSSRHTPHVFERVLARIHALPEVAIFLKLEYARIPIVDLTHRLKVEKYGTDERHFYHITARYGYSEHKIHLFDILQLAATEYHVPVPDGHKITFFIPAITIRVIRKGWRTLPSKLVLSIYSVLKNVFPFGQKNLHLSPDHTVSVGMVVPL
ncbi:unnamed protein product [Rotaria socialis]|uniref:Potassium transporter n=2 Tax=Rotaria socialis TaxID=392032 RepID=A0A817PN58_9BILA|nr:unnamed protein product [Rotaria socialis]CAF3317145.1 unnamed protein product [Rotaria socialis]CAF3526471.1 unnamed protein product [Rotaria socialis]CAF3628818.1 unnamed protein product [Rotaria socialis]CAF4183627.1 unnamed protein product [Rotaria socialis]